MNDFFSYFTRAFEKYFDFEGRDTRKQYWMFFLVYILASIVAAFGDALIGFGVIGLLLALVSIIPSIAISTRRLHDTGRSGWWQLLILIPFIGPIVLLVFLCLPSEEGPNKYGPNPHHLGNPPSSPPPVPKNVLIS